MVVVVQVPPEDAAQRGFADDDHMIQALAPDRADDPLDVGPLPGRPRCAEHFLDAEFLDLLGEVVAEDAVAVPQEIAWRGIPRKGLPELLGGPFCGGVRRDAEVQDPAALVGQHQEHIQNLKPDRRHGEEVDRHHGLEVILQEGAPRLGRRLPVPGHVLADAGFPDVDTELEQFAVNAGSTPERVVPAHPANQVAAVFGNAWSPGLAMPDLPRPEQPKALAMPSNHSFRLHDRQGRPPVGPDCRQPHPEDAICRRQLRSLLGCALEDTDLVAEGEDLDLEGRSAAKRRQDGREERSEDEGWREPTKEAQVPCSHAVRDLREAQTFSGLLCLSEIRSEPDGG